MKNLIYAIIVSISFVIWSILIENTYAAKISLNCGVMSGPEYDLCQALGEKWAKQTGNEITLYIKPTSTTDSLAMYKQLFLAKSDAVDVVYIDVIWPGMIGKHMVDLNQYIPRPYIGQYFKAIVSNNTDSKGRLLAIPASTDAGILYYRKDLLKKYNRAVPKTWEQLKETALYIVKREKVTSPDLAGFVWQGKAYEGLTCNALEWIDSYKGGSIIDENTGEITVNNSKAIQALQMAASWIGTISPREVLDYAEEKARAKFQSGDAVFMRNWPYAWSAGNSPDSPIKGKIGVAPLPKGGNDGKHTGTLGGWNYGVSKYSKHPKEAADLVRFMTSKSSQLERAIKISINPTIPSLYQEKSLLEANPFMGKLLTTFSNAVARPSKLTGKRYSKVSSKFWTAVHDILSGKRSAETGLEKLEKDLHRIKGKKGW